VLSLAKQEKHLLYLTENVSNVSSRSFAEFAMTEQQIALPLCGIGMRTEGSG